MTLSLHSLARRKFCALALTFAILAGSPAALASTWIVDAAGGPGSNFTTISAALAVSLPGDVIVVRAGAYVENLTINHGVTIVGWHATTYPMTVPSNPFQQAIFGTVLFQGVPIGHRATLSGIVVSRPSVGGGYSIGVDQCLGAVVLDRVFTPNGGIFIGDSTDVFLQDVRVRQVPASDPPVFGVLVNNSLVQATDIDCAATDLGTEPNFYFSAPHALSAVNGAVVSMCRPKLIGATGGGPWTTTATTPGGGSAIHCSDSIVSVVGNGNGAFYLIGGQGGVRGAGSSNTIDSGYGGPAVLAEANGIVLLKGAPVPIPGSPGANLAGGPTGFAPNATFVFTGGLVQFLPQNPATMRIVGSTQPGGNATISYLAAGPFYPVTISIATEFGLTPLPPAVQFLGGDPLSSLFVISGTANNARFFQIGINFPASFAGFNGAAVVMQGADVIAGDFYLTNPTVLTLP